MEMAATKFKDDMAHFRTDLFNSIHKMKEDLQEQINENSQFLNDTSKQLNAEISDVRTMATESIKQQNK
jgi:hypothetical protein